MHEIIINNKSYSPIGSFITGAQIKKLANIALSDIVVFQIAGSILGVEVNDNDLVDLSRPGAEHFISRSL
jgi:hypothetical protein